MNSTIHKLNAGCSQCSEPGEVVKYLSGFSYDLVLLSSSVNAPVLMGHRVCVFTKYPRMVIALF